MGAGVPEKMLWGGRGGGGGGGGRVTCEELASHPGDSVDHFGPNTAASP